MRIKDKLSEKIYDLIMDYTIYDYTMFDNTIFDYTIFGYTIFDYTIIVSNEYLGAILGDIRSWLMN